jgi:hypothetical protein
MHELMDVEMVGQAIHGILESRDPTSPGAQFVGVDAIGLRA